VRSGKASPWVYPAVAMAAHTGARKSEIIRCRAVDVDLAGALIPFREKALLVSEWVI
jgi:hypothetical protein